MRFIRIVAIIFSLFAYVMPTKAQIETVPRLFDGKDVLYEQYGITSHITWRGYDYDNYKNNLTDIANCGINKVRIDCNYNAINWGKGKVDYSVWDEVFSEVTRKGLTITPIFSPSRKELYTSDYAQSYNNYVIALLDRYGDVINEWEVWNEMDQQYSKDGKMPPREYAKMLQDAYSRVKAKQPHSTVLMGAIGDIQKDYLQQLLKENAQFYCDALSIHYYSGKVIPEDIIGFYQRLDGILRGFSVNKPIWLTETGYCSYPDQSDPDLFYKEILPVVYKKLGIRVDRFRLAVLMPPIANQPLYKQDNISIGYGFKGCEAFNLNELKSLSVESYPVLMVLYGQRFPAQFFNDLKSYIARGGTVVFPEGGAILYYDWNIQTGEKQTVGKQFYEQLHLDYLFTWDKEAKSIGIKSSIKSAKSISGIQTGYKWSDDEYSNPMFLTSKNLKKGDEFIPLVEGDDGSYRGAVAACYKLNSELKGNIIIQNRSNNTHRIPEYLQALRIPRIFLLPFASGVEKMYYYCYRDISLGDCYGIVTKDYRKKPAYLSYQTLTEKLPSGSTRPVVKKLGHQYIAGWNNHQGEKIYCVWSDVVGSSSNIVVKGFARYYDINGRRIKKRHFSLSPSVVYIERAKSVEFKVD